MITETSNKTSAFQAFEDRPHTGSKRIDEVYAEARASLDRIATPTRRTEAWKYTPVSKIFNRAWNPCVSGTSINQSQYQLADLDTYTIFIVDGEYRGDLSDSIQEEGVSLKSMAEAKDGSDFDQVYGTIANHKEDLFIALNTAFASGGFFFKVNKGIKPTKPVHVVHINTQNQTAVMSRNMLIADEGSQAEIIQSFYHESEVFSNVVSEIQVGDNANLRISKFQHGSDSSSHYSSEQVKQGRDATFSLNTITIDGAWTRNDPHIRLQGMNSVCNLNGAYLPMQNELVDNHSIIDHTVPHCDSHELYKGVVYDQAKGVFNGKVFVRPDAQKTNAYQQNANIVMSDKASMNSKPELEIYADDVKCSHGSTTGQIDRDALFYLQCRGLSKTNAMEMLINAFVGEVVEQLDPSLQAHAWALLNDKLRS